MRRVTIVLVLPVLLMTVGCSSIGRVDGPVFTSPWPGPGADHMGAIIEGVLVFDDATGCLFLDNAGARAAVVWPVGSSWHADPPGVLLVGGALAQPGMWVSGGGGRLPRANVHGVAGARVADAAAACVGSTGEIAVFNLGSEVVVSVYEQGP